MKARAAGAAAILLCALGAFCTGFFLYSFFFSYMESLGACFLCIAAFVCVCLAAVCGGIVREDRRTAYRRIALWMGFILYLFFLGELVFLNREFRRPLSEDTAWSLRQVFSYPGHNLIPLRTVRLMYEKWREGAISRSAFLYNIFGNLAAFMPMAFFLPLLFPRQRSFPIFALTVSGSVLAVELIQLFTMCGAFDTDDLLLNALGAFALFGLLQTPCIRRLLHRLFTGENT